MPNIAKILKDEFSEGFVAAMKSRMVQGYFKYGSIHDKDRTVDDLVCLRQRLKRFEADGNTEWLVDAANFAMIIFKKNPQDFHATSTEASPGRTHRGGRVGVFTNNQDNPTARFQAKLREGD